jgi:hypothetical protein
MPDNRLQEIYEAALEAATPMLPALARMGADLAEQVIEGLRTDGDLAEQAMLLLRQNATAEEWKQIAAGLAEAANRSALQAALRKEFLIELGKAVLFAAAGAAKLFPL